jgi:hypothetical protein
MFYENYTEEGLREEYHDLRWVEDRMNISDIEWHLRDEEVNYRICIYEGKSEEFLLRRLHKKIIKNKEKVHSIQEKIKSIVNIVIVDDENIHHISNFMADLTDVQAILFACRALKVELMKKSIQKTNP